MNFVTIYKKRNTSFHNERYLHYGGTLDFKIIIETDFEKGGSEVLLQLVAIRHVFVT